MLTFVTNEWGIGFVGARQIIPGPEQRMLRQLLASPEAHAPSLFVALQTFCRSSCSDPRDKVFGLQGIVKPGQRVPVDYTASLGTVWRNTMARVISVLMSNYRDFILMVFHGRLQMRDIDIRRLSDVAKAIAGAAEPDDCMLEIAAMRWAHSVPNFPTTLRSTGSHWWKVVAQLADRRATWIEIWRSLADSAVTENQKRLGNEIQQETQTLSHRWDNSNWRVLLKAESQEKHELWRKMDEFASDLTQIMKRTYAKRGFIVEHGFLVHPDEIPFANMDDKGNWTRRPWFTEEKATVE